MNDRDQSEADMMVRAAWLYYVAEKTQNEIASILGVSRVKAARLIGDARTNGIVTIDIDPRLSAQSELEERIRKTFGLQFCYVTPPLDDEDAAIAGSEQGDRKSVV